MAKYRQLYTEFWSDSFVLELTPEEKYFYLYLISNPKSTQSGIYEISQITIETDCGYNRETVEKLIQRFCDYKKILYCDETKELMVINWIKYNVPRSINTVKCIQKELLKVKNKAFVKVLFNKCQEIGLDVDKIFENFKFKDSSENILKNTNIKKSEGACKVLVSKREEVISKKEEVINKKEIEEVIKIFEENVPAITSLDYEKILEFTNHVPSEVIIMAIEEAVKYDARTIKYISKILSSWISLGITTCDEVKAYQKKWVSKNTSNHTQNVKKGSFCDYEQRTYDFDDLEKKLLGHMDNDLE
ncbi:DnaD domain-containing protein [Clostridium sp.]|uniref:DnaD domain-containing protein n=1 Tax=Clostridium sp. TaxID=1506 RepID=UPI001A539842|nr:DnaD domain protein [Clostridium sp.]MBK5240780.1 DnaD domain protein [Clostridium sp.]